MRVLLAGAQSGSHFKDLTHIAEHSETPINILMSYFYMRKMSKTVLHRLLDGLNKTGAFVMLDSGAHTYFGYDEDALESRKHIAAQWQGGKAKVRSKEDKSFVPPKEYMAQYIEFLVEYGHHFNCYVELDIGDMVGLEQIEEWRDQMEARGLTPVPVYHVSYEEKICEERGWSEDQRPRMKVRWEQWEKLLARYPYVGLEGGLERYEYIQFLKRSDKAGVKVHGFAMTNQTVFRHLPFYSVDSTSWLAGQQYGVTYVVQGNKLRTFDKKNKHRRRNYRKQCELYGIDFKKLLDDDPYEVNRFNASSWVEFQAVISRQRRNDVTAKLDQQEELEAMAQQEREKRERGHDSEDESADAEDLLDVNDDEADEEDDERHPLVVRDINYGVTLGRGCDQCYLEDSCPYFEEGAQCSVPFGISKDGPPDPRTMLQELLRISWERFQFALAVEKANGGLLDPEVAKERDSILDLMASIKELAAPVHTEEVVITAKGQAAGGVISKLFGGYGKGGGAKPSQQLPDSDIIDADYTNE